MPLPASFLTAQIATLTAQIAAYQVVIDSYIENGAIITYTLDDGQTRQVVTKMDIVRLEQQVDKMLNRLSVLYAQRDGTGMIIGVPSF